MKLAAFLSAGLVLVLPVYASAEQPAAATYRSYFESGTFLVEFADKKQNYTVAALPNMRLAKVASQYYTSDLDYYNGNKDYPNELYMNGKYYQFKSKKEAAVARENQLYDVNIDPRGRWNNMKNRLSVPLEFYPLCASDLFRQTSKAMMRPVCVESSQTKLDGKDYLFDRYLIPLRSHTGAVLSETQFMYYYEKDKLVRIDMAILHDGITSQTGSVKVKKLTNVVPPNTFVMPKGCKVYEVGTGDMNDLIEQLPVAESY